MYGGFRPAHQRAEPVNVDQCSPGPRRKIHRDEHASELDISVYLTDETSCPRCNEQRRNRGTAEYRLRHRPLEPMLHAVPALGRKHDEIAFMLAQEVDDCACRLLQGEA